LQVWRQAVPWTDWGGKPGPNRSPARLLAVRDLASGPQLLWLPVTDESADAAAAGLEALFREHGAPLVLKSDNGSAFVAEEFGALLDRWGVWQLFSPPRTPRYNGSCEAGIGSMKTRTHHQAALRGCPGEWSCEDAEAARLQANQTARPRGLGGPTPAEDWAGRRPIRPAEREAFAATVRRLEEEVWQEDGSADLPAVRRLALTRAFVAHGLLEFRSGYRQPPLRRRRQAQADGEAGPSGRRQ